MEDIAPTPLDRCRGCLLAGAVGDALGAPVEFLKRAEIQHRFPPQGIQDYAPAYGGLGRITDDTQMTLFTAEGLLQAGGEHPGHADLATLATSVAAAYQRWLQTQEARRPETGEERAMPAGGLWAQPTLHERRAPGNTCLAALQAVQSLGEPAENDSKGCGGVMRVAPAGLLAGRLGESMPPAIAFALGKRLAALTHGHPTGTLPAGVLTVLIAELLKGADLLTALETAWPLLKGTAHHAETLAALEAAEHLAATANSPERAIATLGEGWVAEEALAIAVYCALAAPNLETGLLWAVNHDGDSDSTGAIAGHLLGTIHGVGAIPERWLEPLELRTTLTALADALNALGSPATA